MTEVLKDIIKRFIDDGKQIVTIDVDSEYDDVANKLIPNAEKQEENIK